MTTAMLVPEVAKAVLVCKYFPSSSCILTASGVLLLPGPVIIVLDNVKCTLEVIRKCHTPLLMLTVPQRLGCGII